MTDQKPPVDQGRMNALKLIQGWRGRNAADRAAGIPLHVYKPKPLPDHASVVVNGVPREMHDQLQQLARQSNLSLSQLGLLGLEMLVTGGPDGTPVTLPKWSKLLDR